MSSPSPFRVGFIGLSTSGWASIALAPSLLQPALRDKYSLSAVSTTSQESASTTAKKYTEELGHVVKAYYGDSSKVAGDPEINFVVVSVKAPLHKSVVLPVIEAKKDFFVEWPAGAGLKDVNEIAEATHRQGLRSMVGLQGRHSPAVKKVFKVPVANGSGADALAYSKIKELIDSGKIGTVRSSSFIALVPREAGFWSPAVTEKSIFANDKKNGATPLYIAVGHQLDTFTYILGDVATVSATATTAYPVATVLDTEGNPTEKTITTDSFDHIAFTGLLKSGVVSSIIWRCGYKATKGRRQLLWEIDGEEGSIRIETDRTSGAFMNIRDADVYLNGELIEVGEPNGLNVNLTNAWVEFAKGDTGQYATIDDAVKVHKVLDAIVRSVEERKTIVL